MLRHIYETYSFYRVQMKDSIWNLLSLEEPILQLIYTLITYANYMCSLFLNSKRIIIFSWLDKSYKVSKNKISFK